MTTRMMTRNEMMEVHSVKNVTPGSAVLEMLKKAQTRFTIW